MSKGIITQVIGAVVDVKFDGELPEILTALELFLPQPYLTMVRREIFAPQIITAKDSLFFWIVLSYDDSLYIDRTL